MITFSVQIKGDDRKEIGQFVRAIAFGTEAEIKLSFSGPKSGRAYNRRGRIHIASAPGESPAVDTGFLSNSIQTTVKSDYEAEIVIGAEYAEILEFEKNRPFVRKSIDSVLKRFDSGGFLDGLRD
jgi:hypothetical protein